MLFVPFVYGANVGRDREALWGNLLDLAVSFQSSPWVVIRDFNAIRSLSKAFEGKLGLTNTIQLFNEFIPLLSLWTSDFQVVLSPGIIRDLFY